MNAIAKIDVELLRGLEPLAAFSDGRLAELAGLCLLQAAPPETDPFAARGLAGQAVYLVRGKLSLRHADGRASVITGGSQEARHPLGRHDGMFSTARTLGEVELLRIDDELLDVMATWDAIGSGGPGIPGGVPAPSPLTPANRDSLSRIFASGGFRYGAFAQLPAAHIEELFSRFARIAVRAGDAVIREGDDGDFYYVVEAGAFRVTRMVDGDTLTLAELGAGDAFGEEALVSEAKRNATVTAQAAGTLLRLSKQDFMTLLREPLLHRVSMDEARQKVASGGQWLDVRLASEARHERLPGALNIPLADIRAAIGGLDREREYVVYCQSERRSSAAAFLLVQRGYKAYLLQGGLRGGEGQA
jgi:rhodanese-related sulfurtransferase